MTVLSDVDLAARITDTEDHFTERKSKSDKSGWIRTTVAFANSAPIGYPAILFVGVMDDGTITENGNIEDLMKSYSDTIANSCYPPIYTMPQVFTHSGKSCVVATIPGSEQRPHFAGLSYIRDGTQTKAASEEQFDLLIAQRNSKARLIQVWKGKQITIETVRNRGTNNLVVLPVTAIVTECNQFFVTLDFGSPKQRFRSYPLSRIDLSYEHEAGWLKLVYNE